MDTRPFGDRRDPHPGPALEVPRTSARTTVIRGSAALSVSGHAVGASPGGVAPAVLAAPGAVAGDAPGIAHDEGPPAG
ncbi:MAG TPA: hypothetical protein VKG43_07170 [Acidimicrobiales bacterium]|nr:hypothetical protein [Acidimicrobiales bacterium]